ncbi:MAG: hypothetical protein WAV95_17230 [Azonexus sp.]
MADIVPLCKLEGNPELPLLADFSPLLCPKAAVAGYVWLALVEAIAGLEIRLPGKMTA